MSDAIVDGGESARFDHAFEIGGLWICPVGTAHPGQGELFLELQCDGIFGSGLHPTTQLCIERLLETPGAEVVLDVGAGTGILGLAALRLGSARAILLDVDPKALEISAANAARNGLQDRVHIDPRPVSALTERYPLILANMPSAELIEIAPMLARLLASKGRLILAGIYETQLDEVRRVFRDLGLNAGAPERRNGWCSLELWPSW